MEPERKWLFYAVDENGDGRYLQESYFEGIFSDAAACAESLGDAWEETTGGLITRLVIESHGKIKTA
jgi:hypothetical protein